MNATDTSARPYSPLWRLVTVIVLRPLVQALIRNRWEGQENIPWKGGVILAPNHLSYLDWAPDGAFFHACGRYPEFLIKASAFRVPGIGKLLRSTGQVPVDRGGADAALALTAAAKRLADGAAIVIYPEGTATRDPGLWPMTGRTGVARLALATRAPVIPVALWGSHDILPYGSKKPRLFPRKTVRVIAGPPVDLSHWAGQQNNAKALRAATDAIMAQVTALVAHLREQAPPPVPYNPKNPAGAVRGRPALSPSPSAGTAVPSASGPQDA